jgi:CLIP-associating protein 1/2
MNGKGGNGPLSPLGAGSEDNFTMIFPPAVSAVNGPEQSTIPQQPVSSTTSEESQPASFADEDNFTLVIPIRGMSNTRLPPLNTQVDVLPTIIDEPTKTMTMTVPVMQPITTNGLIDDFELIPTDTTPTITMTSPMQEAQLIVFEDTSAEDLIVPQSGTSPTRAALEELHPSEQNQVIASTEEPLEEKSIALAGPRTRSVSPVKRSKITPNLDAAQDRAEVLKTRRLFASGVERIKAHTLDIHGFRKVQELIKTNPQNPDLKYNDLLAALLDFLKSEDDDTKVNNVKAQALKSQTLTTLRLLQSQGLSYQGMQAALLSVLVASGQCTKNSHLALDLERTADGIVSQGKQDCLNMLQAVLSFAENIGWNDKILLVSCFRVLGKLFIVIREKQDQLDMQVVQRLGKVSRRCFGDLDADVRRAVTQCCLEWHAAMGQENEQLFWRTLNGISEAQLNLLAYYMARRGAAVAAAS